MLNDFKGFFDVLNQFTARGDQQQSGGQQTPPKVATNKPPKAKKNPKKGDQTEYFSFVNRKLF